MDLDRRNFLQGTMIICTLLFMPVSGLLQRTTETKAFRALRGRFYPGPVRKLDKGEVCRTADWAG